MQGRLLGFDPQAVTADAEWVKHRLSRAADTLPNGYCGRPPQHDCPHPQAHREEITRLRSENQELRGQLARHLGAARAAGVTRSS